MIDSTYFFGNILIPNKDKPRILAGIQELINSHENIFFESVLGVALTQRMIDFPSDPEIVKLVNGTTYEVSGKTYKWKGLKYVIGDSKYALSALYIFFQWLNETSQSNLSTGQTVSSFDNSERVSNSYKASRVWNEMCGWVRELRLYLKHSVAYPEWNSTDSKVYRPINPLNV